MAEQYEPSVEVVVTSSLLEVDGAEPLLKVEPNQYLMVTTSEARLRVRATSKGEIEIHVTNAPHRGQPRTKVIPVMSNVVIIEATED